MATGSAHGVKYLSDLISNLNKTCESLGMWQNWMSPSKTSLPPIGTNSQQTTVVSSCKKVPLDASGVYLFQPSESIYPYPVYCDQESFIGSQGWIVIQNRKENGQLSFDRDWTEYRDGFGDPRNEFWLGLEKIYQLMKRDEKYELLVMMRKKNGKTEAARYSTVSIGGEEDGYALELGSYAFGSAGHTMEFSNKAKFSTPDSNHDGAGKECAQQLRSGWWFSDCDDLPSGPRRTVKLSATCDKRIHPYKGYFYMGDPCLDETRILIREL
ncbi:microfibril-associated glycoprotein 4-like [Ochlerotatus camptorhynchus]|uniref:microfibril-associated glycoprotein 4-like n=1 Tax=Ochlerotatus camptorhynchus TaxID=644619 RepID=UPI0031D831E1